MSSDDQDNLTQPDLVDPSERIDEFAQELKSANSPNGHLVRDARELRSFALRYSSNAPDGDIEQVEPMRETSVRHPLDNGVVDDSPDVSRRRKIISTSILICAAMALFAGAAFYTYSVSSDAYQYLKSNALASTRWPSTTGTITKSKLNYRVEWVGKYSNTYFEPYVAFEYSVNGRSYSNHRISFPNPRFADLYKGNRFIDNYAVGNKVRVFYAPSDPVNSCLKNGVTEALTTRFSRRLDLDHAIENENPK
jgi:hypothetical protein